MQLSARREKFVDEYILDHNGSRAARAAGYAASGARVTAHRLLTDANVIAAISRKQLVIAQSYELNKDVVVRELLSAVDIAREKLDSGNMIRAWIEIARLLGFYAPELILENVNSDDRVLKAQLESMSDEQLLKIAKGNG